MVTWQLTVQMISQLTRLEQFSNSCLYLHIKFVKEFIIKISYFITNVNRSLFNSISIIISGCSWIIDLHLSWSFQNYVSKYFPTCWPELHGEKPTLFLHPNLRSYVVMGDMSSRIYSPDSARKIYEWIQINLQIVQYRWLSAQKSSEPKYKS